MEAEQLAVPPDLRNHLEPTGGDTPASRAASSLERPVAIAAQNRTSSSRRAESGRPGECNLLRPDRSDRRLRTVIAMLWESCSFLAFVSGRKHNRSRNVLSWVSLATVSLATVGGCSKLLYDSHFR